MSINCIYKASYSAFTANVHYIYPRLQRKLSVALQTHGLPACLSFLISIKRRADVMSASTCCFGYYQENIK